MKKNIFRKNFLKDIEARVFPVSVLLLLIMVAVSSIFVFLPDTVEAADSTLRQENFDDDTPEADPSDTWYSYSETADYFQVNDTTAYSGSNSLKIWGAPSSNEYGNFTLNTNFSGANFSMRFNVTQNGETHQNSYFRLWDEDDFNFINFQTGRNTEDENAMYFWYGATPTKDEPEWVFAYNTWHQLGIDFNFSTQKFQGWMTNETGNYNTSWQDFFSGSATTEVSMFSVGCTDDGTYMYIDDIQFGDDDGETSSSFSLGGGVGSNNNITWSGEAGDTVYSNATAGLGGTLNISYDVNASDNLTEIRVNLSHLNVTQGILNSNISLIFDDDNSSWTGDVVAYSGTNFTINESIWSTNSWGGSPFPIDGEGWTNGSMYCRMRLAIPSGATADTYTAVDWKIWYKLVS